MNYLIKRNNNPVASVHPEGQLQTSVMGEELVTMTFSLINYIHFQTGDTVEVYGNIYYLATEPNVEKLCSRDFRYSLEFQGIKYELAKVQYLFPDAQNVLNLSDFHIMGTARQMLDLLVQNANRITTGWSLGTIDTTEAKQLSFSAENCLSVLAKIAQEFKLEYWVDGDKSIHLTERKVISGYTFEYGKAKGLRSLTRQTYNNSNIVTRLYAFGSEKNIAGNYRGGQQKLRMNVPYLEKNTNIYGVIEGSQTFDVYPHRLGTVTAVNPSNPLQFTDSGMDFDLNARENGNTKYLINGVPVKVTFNTGQLAGYTFEVKEFGYNTATKTFTLLKNTDEKAIEVPSETLRPAVGDRYVLTDLIMPESYITNAEAELQQKAQEYLNENSRQRVIYSLVTDPFYFEAQNVNIALGSTVRAVDSDFNLDEHLRVIRLIKDLQNPFNVQMEVAERAEIAYIVREYLESEKAKSALMQADKFNAEMARRAYRFGREISENVFDGEGYFNAEKIKPLSIETKLLSVGSRMQQFALPDVLITVPNATTVANTQGKIVHLSLEEQPREWNIAANTQSNISSEFNYVYIKAQRNGTNASVFVSPEKIGVESDADFYHFEAGYLGSVENGQRRLRMSHGFTQINPFEITTGRIAPPSGNHYIALEPDRIKFVGDVTFSAESEAIKQVNQISQQQVDNIKVGGRNLALNTANFGEITIGATTPMNITRQNYIFPNLQIGEVYRLSFDGKVNDGTASVVHWEIHGGAVGLPDKGNVTISGSDYKRYSVFIRLNNSNKHLFVWLLNGTPCTVKNLKIYKGTQTEDWSPAPEDTQQQINSISTNVDKITQKTDFIAETRIEGNTVATGTMVLGNQSGANTGITGEGNVNDVSIYSGSTYANRNNAPFRVHRNGTLYAENANISGRISANNGKIGDFSISQSGLFKDISTTNTSFGANLSTQTFELIGRIYQDLTNFYTERKVKVTCNDIVITERQSSLGASIKGIKITADGIYRIQNNTETKIL